MEETSAVAEPETPPNSMLATMFTWARPPPDSAHKNVGHVNELLGDVSSRHEFPSQYEEGNAHQGERVDSRKYFLHD